MCDLFVDVDTNVILPVNILPLLDDTDFKSIETAIVYNQAGLVLTWNFVTAAGVVTGNAITPTTGGAFDWSEPLADVGMYAIEMPASGQAAGTNNDREGMGWFTGVATGVLPWRGPTIGFRRAALNDLFMDGSTASTNMEDFFDGTGYAGGTAKLGVDVISISGDTTAADNAELMFDGTGYAGGSAKLAVDVDTIKTQTVTCAAPVTVLASVGTAATSTAQTGDSFPLVSTEVAEIYAAVITNAAGADIAADIIAVKADTAAILADTGTDGVVVKAAGLATDAVAEIADGVWDEIITAGQHNIKNSAARILRQASGGTNVTLHSGTAQSGTTSTIVLDNAASATNDVYNRNLIALVGGTGTGQTRRIVDYVGSSRTVYIDVNWVVNPDATTQFEVIAAPTSIFADEGVAQAGGSDYIDLAATASTTDDIYNNSLITITGGTGSGQTEVITDYTGATRRASIAAETWGTPPDSTSIYAVIPGGNIAPDTGSVLPAPTASEVADAVWDELKATHTIADSFGDYLDDEITSRATQTSVDTIDDFLDTEIGDIYAAVVTDAAGTNIAADIIAIKAETASILTDTAEIGVAGAGLTAVPWNANWDAEVESEANDALVTNNLDHIALTATGIPAIPAGTYLDQMMDDGTAVYDRTTDSLQALRDNLATAAALDAVDNFVDTEIGAIITTLGTPVTSIAADIAAIEAQTDDIGIAGAGLTAVPWNSNWDAEVQSEVDDALVAHNLDHIAGTATGIPAIPAGTFIDQIMDDGTAVYDRTTDSLQAIRDNMTAGADAATIADAVWDEVINVGHATPNSAAVDLVAILEDTGTTLDDLVDDLESRLSATRAGYLDNLSAGAVALQASVDDLEGRLTATRAGYLDNLSAGAVALQANVDDLEGRLTAIRAGYLDNLSVGAVALEATAQLIKASTDNLPASPAAVGSQMDLVNAPNATAITAIQSGLATAASIAALNNLSASQVNAEVVDALNVDTYAEPGQGAPAATVSLAAKIGYLYKAWRNKKTQTAVTRSLYNDAGDTVDQKATDSDDGTTFTKGELGTGP